MRGWGASGVAYRIIGYSNGERDQDLRDGWALIPEPTIELNSKEQTLKEKLEQAQVRSKIGGR